MAHSNATTRSPSDEQAAAPARPAVAGKRRALIVDSDSASATLCEMTLERMGFAIERVGGGVAAVVAARRQAPDLIVMDFQLPDASAGETIGWLRGNQTLSAVPIVVLGTAGGSQLPVKDARATAFLAKPLTAATIERAVHSLCG
jgi:CheY-like chemotaxis protein